MLSFMAENTPFPALLERNTADEEKVELIQPERARVRLITDLLSLFRLRTFTF